MYKLHTQEHVAASVCCKAHVMAAAVCQGKCAAPIKVQLLLHSLPAEGCVGGAAIPSAALCDQPVACADQQRWSPAVRWLPVAPMPLPGQHGVCQCENQADTLVARPHRAITTQLSTCTAPTGVSSRQPQARCARACSCCYTGCMLVLRSLSPRAGNLPVLAPPGCTVATLPHLRCTPVTSRMLSICSFFLPARSMCSTSIMLARGMSLCLWNSSLMYCFRAGCSSAGLLLAALHA
mmetsp:Transcript_22890/g.58381  ORF Transcript_22890/g.58381 Transcript_22890/m.58381 type:complete len:236 (+) Transcript_22890:291-998(+)